MPVIGRTRRVTHAAASTKLARRHAPHHAKRGDNLAARYGQRMHEQVQLHELVSDLEQETVSGSCSSPRSRRRTCRSSSSASTTAAAPPPTRRPRRTARAATSLSVTPAQRRHHDERARRCPFANCWRTIADQAVDGGRESATDRPRRKFHHHAHSRPPSRCINSAVENRLRRRPAADRVVAERHELVVRAPGSGRQAADGHRHAARRGWRRAPGCGRFGRPSGRRSAASALTADRAPAACRGIRSTPPMIAPGIRLLIELHRYRSGYDRSAPATRRHPPAADRQRMILDRGRLSAHRGSCWSRFFDFSSSPPPMNGSRLPEDVPRRHAGIAGAGRIACSRPSAATPSAPNCRQRRQRPSRRRRRRSSDW